MAPKVVLVVDDDSSSRDLVGEILRGSYHVELAADGLEALAKLKLGVDLMLLDLSMPGMDGFEVLRRVRSEPDSSDLPVVLMTGLSARYRQMEAMEAGASDFLGKPFGPAELLTRVRTHLRIREADEQLKAQDFSLEARVDERTARLRRSIDEAVAAQREAWQAHLDTIRRLALASDYKDHGTASHASRIAEYCVLLGEGLNLPPGEIELLRYASPMHDVGKIGIPDAILLKPAPLTPEERRVMERHTEIGASILSGSSSRLLQAGETIALSHHEHWDGRGYPRRLSGLEIPLWGRICAVADFFDALTSARPYRPAISVDETLEMMGFLEGTHFDPSVLRLFFEQEKRVRAVFLAFEGID